jgi:uncharacterized membrane protein YraQ (UPF0718 family)
LIEQLINSGIVSLLSISKESKLAESLTFFIYDTIKILFLLLIMISLIGYLRTYVSQKKIKEMLSGKKLGIGNIFASIFGAITPFCSCSSIPFFMGFTKAGIPLGVSLSFLITSPLVNEYLAVIMLATLGWKITVAYIIAGILIGVVSGIIIGKMNLENEIEKEFQSIKNNNIKEKIYSNQRERLKFGINEAISITKSIWLWVLAGVGIGAILHGYVPQEFLRSLINKGGMLSVPIATLIGVPLYANCAAIVPIAVVLLEKGVPLGTALSFMMAIAALSLPEAIILRRVMKLKLIAVFFGIVTIGIIILGYLFNFLQPFLI